MHAVNLQNYCFVVSYVY